jgi:hypothetical protein
MKNPALVFKDIAIENNIAYFQRSLQKHSIKTTATNTEHQSRKERRQKLQTIKPTMEKRSRRDVSMIIGVLSFLIGLIAFLFFVYPRLSVLPGESLDLHTPFQTPFIVKNDGYWPLMDVNYDLTIEKMETINGCKLINCGVSGIATKIPKLRINESSTIYINRAVGAPADRIKYVELYINVKYRPYLIPITFTENKRFKTNRKTNGDYVWFSFHSEK